MAIPHPLLLPEVLLPALFLWATHHDRPVVNALHHWALRAMPVFSSAKWGWFPTLPYEPVLRSVGADSEC